MQIAMTQKKLQLSDRSDTCQHQMETFTIMTFGQYPPISSLFLTVKNLSSVLDSIPIAMPKFTNNTSNLLFSALPNAFCTEVQFNSVPSPMGSLGGGGGGGMMDNSALLQEATAWADLAWVGMSTLWCQFGISSASVIFGLPASSTLSLQHTQNNASASFSERQNADNITTVLTFLHWLPVSQRIQYKVSTLCNKRVCSSVPFCHFGPSAVHLLKAVLCFDSLFLFEALFLPPASWHPTDKDNLL